MAGDPPLVAFVVPQLGQTSWLSSICVPQFEQNAIGAPSSIFAAAMLPHRASNLGFGALDATTPARRDALVYRSGGRWNARRRGMLTGCASQVLVQADQAVVHRAREVPTSSTVEGEGAGHVFLSPSTLAH